MCSHWPTAGITWENPTYENGSLPVDARRLAVAFGLPVAGMAAAALLSQGVAKADDPFVFTIEPAGTDQTVLSISGTPPFDQTIIESGDFQVDFPNGGLNEGPGIATFTENAFGFQNAELVYANHLALYDVTSFGNGFANDYYDYAGIGGQPDSIGDTFVTPFGDFNIPTTFDALAFTSGTAAAEAVDPSNFASVLDADFTSLLTELGSLF
jgi:hypothetical protein